MMPASVAAESIRRSICSRRFRFSNEKQWQDGIAAAFAEEAIPFEREVSLAPGDIVDFMVGGVGVEVKIDGSLAAVTRQLHRYAGSARVDSLVLVSSRSRLLNLPCVIGGKPLSTVLYAGGLL